MNQKRKKTKAISMVENQLYHFGFDECWFDYFAFITTSITFSIIFAILTVIFLVGLFFSKNKRY